MAEPAVFLFDTHVHLDLLPGPTPSALQVDEARQAGVRGFVVPGVAAAGWEPLLDIVHGIPGAWAALGLHPLEATAWRPALGRRLEELLADPRVVAVGEVGLDGSAGAPAPALQEAAFREQVQLAVAAGKPLLIHCRQATARTLEILTAEHAQRVGGIFHAFSGSLETAREALRLGFSCGFGGPLTYPGARRAVAVLQDLPAGAIVLETDAPDLAPSPWRGQPNRPVWLLTIAEQVARLRGWSLEETARLTTANARRIFKLQSG